MTSPVGNSEISPQDPWWLREKMPYVITILIAALGWTVVRTADRFASLPFIEFSIVQSGADSSIRLKNITNDKAFECVMVLFALSDDKNVPLEFAPQNPTKMAIRGHTLFKSSPRLSNSPTEIVQEISGFGPGSDMELTFQAKNEAGRLRVFASQCENSLGDDTSGKNADESRDKSTGKEDSGESQKAKSKFAPILIERSWKTFFVQYDIEILWFAMFIWICMFSVFSIVASKRKERTARSDESSGIDDSG